MSGKARNFLIGSVLAYRNDLILIGAASTAGAGLSTTVWACASDLLSLSLALATRKKHFDWHLEASGGALGALLSVIFVIFLIHLFLDSSEPVK